MTLTLGSTSANASRARSLIRKTVLDPSTSTVFSMLPDDFDPPGAEEAGSSSPPQPSGSRARAIRPRRRGRAGEGAVAVMGRGSLRLRGERRGELGHEGVEPLGLLDVGHVP